LTCFYNAKGLLKYSMSGSQFKICRQVVYIKLYPLKKFIENKL